MYESIDEIVMDFLSNHDDIDRISLKAEILDLLSLNLSEAEIQIIWSENGADVWFSDKTMREVLEIIVNIIEEST